MKLPSLRSAARRWLFADAKPNPPLKTDELLREWGVPATGIDFQGRVTPAYNTALMGKDWFAKVDQMRAEGGQLQSLELCLSLPIQAAEWYIEEGPSKELNALAQTVVFEHGSRTFSEYLRQGLLGRIWRLIQRKPHEQKGAV